MSLLEDRITACLHASYSCRAQVYPIASTINANASVATRQQLVPKELARAALLYNHEETLAKAAKR